MASRATFCDLGIPPRKDMYHVESTFTVPFRVDRLVRSLPLGYTAF